MEVSETEPKQNCLLWVAFFQVFGYIFLSNYLVQGAHLGTQDIKEQAVIAFHGGVILWLRKQPLNKGTKQDVMKPMG